MRIELALLVVLFCLNLFVILTQLFRYSFYRGSKILYLRKCLFFGVICAVQSCTAFVCLMLPQSKALTFFVLCNEVIGLVINCLMVQIMMGITRFMQDESEGWLNLLYSIPVIGGVLAATNGLHHNYAGSVVKAADGIGYLMGAGLSGTIIGLLSTATLLITFFLILWSEWKDRSVNLKSNLLMLLSILILPLLTYAEMILEGRVGINYHFSRFVTFIPVYIIYHVSFDCLRSARSRAMELVEDAYFLFDKWGSLVDANPRGEAFFRQYLPGEQANQKGLKRLIGGGMGESAEQFQAEAAGIVRHYNVALFDSTGTIGCHCGSGYILREVLDCHERDGMADIGDYEDRLTGLKNRRYFNDNAHQAVHRCRQEGTPLTLLMMDLDHFKNINDTHDRSVGDEILVQVCQVCLKNLRKRDILFRYGGEELAILGEDMSRFEGERIAKRIVEAVAQHPYQTAAGEIRATISIGGCTLVPEFDAGIDLWIDSAERQLYLAKASGRNRVCYQTWENIQRFQK